MRLLNLLYITKAAALAQGHTHYGMAFGFIPVWMSKRPDGAVDCTPKVSAMWIPLAIVWLLLIVLDFVTRKEVEPVEADDITLELIKERGLIHYTAATINTHAVYRVPVIERDYGMVEVRKLTGTSMRAGDLLVASGLHSVDGEPSMQVVVAAIGEGEYAGRLMRLGTAMIRGERSIRLFRQHRCGQVSEEAHARLATIGDIDIASIA